MSRLALPRLRRQRLPCGWLQTGHYGMRWRSKQEVLDGKGQFTCGAKGCLEQRSLASFEVPFAYVEAGKQKQALVKVSLGIPVRCAGSSHRSVDDVQACCKLIACV